MCFVLLLYRMHAAFPVLLAANREERRDRLATPPHPWPGAPRVWAGRDEVAGGTWLGVNEFGLVAAVTNRRSEANNAAAPSRGGLCAGVLHQRSATDAHVYLASEIAEKRFNPFNLLSADLDQAWVGSWRGEITPLHPGIHVVVSQGDVDDRSLPRVRRGHRLAQNLDLSLPLPSLLQAMGRTCANLTRPDPICRPGGVRGTVSSSLLALDLNGRLAAYWHADGPPSERPYISVVGVSGYAEAAAPTAVPAQG